MKNKLIRVLIFFLIIFLISFVMVFSQSSEKIIIQEGKNLVFINVSNPFYVSHLIKLNPAIDAVSYTIDNKTVGYVNFLGGVGEDFVITKGVEYEIISKKDISLLLPGDFS